MATPDLIVRGQRVVTPEGVRPAAVHIRDGKIVSVTDLEEAPAGARVHEAGERVVLPGVVDTHVHLNEPGRAEWEGFRTGTRAAAAGGVTTLVEMPLNSIPATTSVAGLREKLSAADGQSMVDLGFWGGVVPGNAAELEPLWQAGVYGFKCFLVPSGVPEFPEVTEADLREALPVLARLGAPLLAHAELPGPIERAAAEAAGGAGTKYSAWLASRPEAAENEAIELLLRLAKEFRARVHIVHLCSAQAVPQLRRARAEGVAASAETCPHYLLFAAEEIPDGATEFKCAPPIRERANREELWKALGDGAIDFIASDHSPCPPEMKCHGQGDFLRAWGGIASLQLTLAAAWTGMSGRGFGLEHLAGWMCSAPARLAGLQKRKGAIAPGYDADLVIWDSEARFVVQAAELHHRHKLTPYAALTLLGVVETTYLRGRRVFDRGEFPAEACGQVLRRGLR